MEKYFQNCPLTLNTIRICANNPMDISVEISRIGFSNMKPNAVILVNKDEVFDGIAATPLVHLPINAAILFTECNNLRKETLNEIKRLSPKGYKGIHVILVGNISKNISLELNNNGFKTHHIEGSNHYETACMIPKVREEFKNILIISGEDYSEGIVAAYWSAHHGDPILFTKKDSIPCCALEVIKKIKNINIYLIGSTKTISKSVENYLSKLDNVKHLDRIDGENPYDIAVNFAKYKDPKTDFGWGRNYKEGHAFTFGELNHPMEIIAGVLFAHMGKHTPLLLTKKDKIPSAVKKYIKLVKPMIPKDMPSPPFMHGFILGTAQNIGYEAQVMIEDALSIDHEMMDMEHDGHNSDHMCMHHKHHPNHMMYMKHGGHDLGCCMHMDHQHDMDGMEHEEHDSNDIHMHSMHHPDHMMYMKHGGHDLGCCMHMDHHHHMVDMEHEEHDLDDIHMHSMHNPDNMMDMKHDGHDSSCCMHMDHKHHMADMEHDVNEEMNNDYNHKMSDEHRFENLNCNYRRVSINEILD